MSAPVRPAPLSDTAVMVHRSVRHSLRNVDALFVSVLLPVLLMLLMTTVFGGAMDIDGSYVDYVVPGVIVLCAGYGASTTAMSVTKDMTEGIVTRFRTMNVLPSAVLTGHVAASVLRNLVSTGLVVLTALAIGFRPHAGLGGWLGALALLVLFITAMSWLSAAFGLVARSVEGASALGFVLLFLPYLSSAFVPVHTLPGWLQPIAEHQPFSPLIEAIRELLLGTGVGDAGWIAVVWCAGLLMVSAAATAVLWRRSRG